MSAGGVGFFSMPARIEVSSLRKNTMIKNTIYFDPRILFMNFSYLHTDWIIRIPENLALNGILKILVDF